MANSNGFIFKTLKGDTIRVDIQKAGSSISTDGLALAGDSPVTIEYNCDDIFSPLKTSTCSVSIITDSPLLNLHTGQLTEVCAYVYRNNTLIWYGYLTPNVYSMPYDSKNNRITLEFVDPLTAMEDKKFAKFGDTFFATFKQYIQKALSVIGASGVVTKIVTKGTINIDITNTGCVQRNYIDETQDEDEGAMTWREVLSSIARYLNMTILIYGDTLYIVDNLANGQTAKSLYIAGDGNLSLGDVYNKLTVVANNNPLDNAIPDILEEKNFTAQTNTEEYHQVEYFADQSQYSERSALHYDNDGYDRYYLMNAAYRSSKWQLSASYVTKAYTAGLYDSNVGLTEPPTTGTSAIVPWANMMVYRDAPGSYAGETKPKYSLQTTHILGSFIQRYCSVPKKGVTSSLSWSRCLTLAGNGSKAILTDTPQFVGKGGYLILSLSYMMSFCAYPQSEVMGFNINKEELKALKCMLSIGNKYWNGSAWTTTPSTFTVSHLQEEDYLTGTEVKVDNEVSWSDKLNTNKEGVKIPLPTDYVISGAVNFYIENIATSEHVCPLYYHITELALQYATSTTIKDVFNMEEYDADIKYTGKINEANVSEADDVEFTTNTYTDRATSYSYALKLYNGTYTYIGNTLGSQNQEQCCIERMVNYYSIPKKQYQVEIEDSGITPIENISVSHLGRTMTIGTVSFNLADNTAEVTLLEI